MVHAHARAFLGAAILGMAAGAVSPARAALVFDLEGVTPTASQQSRPGALTSLSLTQGGLTLTLSRPGAAFDVIDNATLAAVGLTFPAGWGRRSLDPFSYAGNAPFVINFSAPISGFSVDYGDFGGDSDGFSLRAYDGLDGSGVLIDEAIDGTWGQRSLPDFATASVSGVGIRSIVMIGGSSSFANSVFYDNFTVLAEGAQAITPEPGTLAGAALGVLAIGGAVLRGRRRGA